MMELSSLKWVTAELIESAQSLLTKMTDDQKVGQVMCIGIEGYELKEEERELIRENAIGGVLLSDRNIKDVDQLGWLVYDIQRTARGVGNPGLFIAIEQEGGDALRLNEEHGFTEVLSPMGMGATGNPILAYITSTMLAQEMKAVGINWNLAPTITLANNCLIGRMDKTLVFGSDPEMVGKFANEFIRGTQESGVIAGVKGISCDAFDLDVDGSTSDAELSDRSELVPLKKALRARPNSVLLTHENVTENDVETNKIEGKLSECIRKLRETLGYQGLIVFKSKEMGVGDSSGPTIAAAMRAGADVLLQDYTDSENPRKALAELVRQVSDGELPMERLNEAVLRILIFKARYQLLDLVAKDPQLKRMPGVEERSAQSRADAAKAITILRNENGLLPLSADQKVLVIGYQDTQGTTSQEGEAKSGKIRGIGEKLGAEIYLLKNQELTGDEIENIIEAGKGKTVIAITSGAKESNFQQQVVEALHKAIDELIVIAVRCPEDVQAFPYIHTYVVSYGFNPAHMDALVSVLTGKEPPQGKLPVDIPDLFPMGSGLNKF